MKKFILISLLIILAILGSHHEERWTYGQGTAKYVRNVASLPTYNQLQDYTVSYTGKATDVMATYDNLVNVPDLVVNPVVDDEWYVQTPPWPAPIRAFAQADWNDIRQGRYHCAPASGAMILQYWAADRGFAFVGQGGRTVAQYIFAVSVEMDTNDVNVAIRSGDHRGHYATFNDQIGIGMKSYVASKYAGTFPREPERRPRGVATLRNWDRTAYMNEIDNNRPVILKFFRAGTRIGHAVVGFGYDLKGTADQTDDEVIYRDSWQGVAEASRRFADIRAAVDFSIARGRKDGFRTNEYGDIAISDRYDYWDETIMLTFEIVSPEVPVGGYSVPIDISVSKSDLVAPYIALASLTVVATTATAIYIKRVKRRKQKH